MTNKTKHKYIAVCAARDEDEFIDHSLRSVLNQTKPPEICILSDDGSSDDTRIIAKRLGATVVINNRKRHSMREINQVRALNYGIIKGSQKVPDWKFLLKFDADTEILPEYVQHIITIMVNNPKLGICSGIPEGEKIRLARASDAAKIYRRECWDDIHGLDQWIAFDSHAIIKASQAGWESKTLKTITFRELRKPRKYNLKRWILTGFERAAWGFPLYHTVFASIKNIVKGSPPIINALATVLSHIINPWPKSTNLDHDWVKKNYAINEIRFFINEIIGRGGK